MAEKKQPKTNKQIKLNYEGTEYTLEFNRKTVQQMERTGFDIEDLSRKPMTTIPTLFQGAFLMHHKWVKRETIDNIYEELSDKDDLLAILVELYNEPLKALFDSEDSKEKEGNASWRATF